jgi:hypothetical protein
MLKNEYDYETILKEHEEELRNIHNIFNQEIRDIKDNYNMKINILQMQLEEIEMKQYIMKEKLLNLILKL